MTVRIGINWNANATAKPRQPKRNPTCVEVVGPAYARRTDEVYIDNSVLDAWEVDEREEILRHGKASVGDTASSQDSSRA